MKTLAANALLTRLRPWVDAGALRPLDLALTAFIHEQAPEADAAVLLAVALVSERNGHGHVCLDLAAALAHPDDLLTRLRDDAMFSPQVRSELVGLLAGWTAQDWAQRLTQSPAVTNLQDLEQGGEADPPNPVTPLVLAGSCERPLLYLSRYWRYETRIRQGIAERLRRPVTMPEDALRRLLALVFGQEADADSWQQVACALAARSAFAIITGGPGTGKTTTVVRLLAVLQGLALGRGEPALRIRLAAPTGKAAARLNESIAARVASLPFGALPQGEQMRGQIPTEVTTLHRLLGPIPDSRHFRHHADNPLTADLVVVDEASMVDVEMMANLLDALRPDARLILLGDKDQLASVEAGAVLGDLCQRARGGHYRPETCAWLERVTGERIDAELTDPEGRALDQCIAMLRRSYRFRPEGGIGALAQVVNEGVLDRQVVMDRFGAALQLLNPRGRAKQDASLGRIQAVPLRGEQDPALDDLLREGYRGYLEVMVSRDPGDAADQVALDDWARAVLDAHGRFQLLTALRRGPWGVEGLNARALDILVGPPEGRGQWFPGRPVLVTRNDYGLRLMNGDIGLTLAVPVRRDGGAPQRVLRVAFPTGDGSGGIRWLLPSRLQAAETVFAMTVHKSQGSEFAHTALVLPDAPNPVLTRELVYTAITRSKETFTLLYSRDDVLRDALERQVRRMSGIAGSLAT
ncbi:exodeoxyribonuclease V subunit alpha [Thiocystis violacea]|uniref:exodeoxyribonuclease V subunit alpha n=1 Tax=Thiocystis violacea TaxID=13725 RepID=UPI00190403CF|nr:exodeoxyribonuclease V subunit alpha [Thiocystis violacea]MBK1723094.1 exodeoxyribonuclease V subunit alpha [Thiocystis violacea]